MDTSDDAGVFVLNDTTTIVQTLDFITPVVDDPYFYGAIAAANAISDVYAMGGTPLTALNVVCFPSKKLSMDILKRILEGGTDKMKEASVILVGGHSIDDDEPKYGLVVTGVIEKDKIIKNKGSKQGDKVILTKPLGLGSITTAAKFQKVDKEILNYGINIMCQLNKMASEIMKEIGVNAATDVTGYGLIGHGYEMAKASNVTLVIDSKKVPVIEGAIQLAKKKIYSGGVDSNPEYVGEQYSVSEKVPDYLFGLLTDAQTSGGLLISINEDKSEELLNRLQSAGIKDAAIIGEITKYNGKSVVFQ